MDLAILILTVAVCGWYAGYSMGFSSCSKVNEQARREFFARVNAMLDEPAAPVIELKTENIIQ